MLGFQGGVSIPLVKGGVKAPPAKCQCRAGPKVGARRGFTSELSASYALAAHEISLINSKTTPSTSNILQINVEGDM